MKQTERRRTRALLGTFCRQVGNETLNVRVYRDRRSCVLERELVERDGTTFTMVFPFEAAETMKTLLMADPLYGLVRSDVDRIFGKVDRSLRSADGQSKA